MAPKLTALQEQKVLRVFTIFFDINNDGVIEWEDFEMAIEKVRTLHQWEASGEKYLRALEAIKLIWDGLKHHADKDQDGKISQDEWSGMWANTIEDLKTSKQLPSWLTLYQEFMFDVNDTSGDNFIDKEEYTTVYTGYNLTVDECHKAFDKFQCGAGLTKDQFAKLWVEYFTSDNPEAPGNHLFGYLEN